MNPPHPAERRALQAVIACLSLIPVLTGVAGVLLGPSFLRVEPPWPVDLDSHFRFLSAIFLAIGVGFVSTVPNIERRMARFRFLAILVFVGGLGRLLSLLVAGAPSAGHLIGLVSELVIVPLLVVWQARVARGR